MFCTAVPINTMLLVRVVFHIVPYVFISNNKFFILIFTY